MINLTYIYDILVFCLDALEKFCPESIIENPHFDTIIWDGMVLLQQLTSALLQTFADVSGFLLRRIMKKKIVYFVTDQYKEGSIKTYERQRRKSTTGSLRMKIERREQKCPKQWSKFLAVEENKTELVKFLHNDWSHPTRYLQYFEPGQALFINVEDDFFKIAMENGAIVSTRQEELHTDQEEADTKVFLCAKHCSTPCCISTVDTDIAIYAVYFSQFIQTKMFIEIGVRDRKRILNVENIVINLGEKVSKALPALHCFTGNDYTSAFHGIGKKKALKLIMENEIFAESFASLGNSFVFESSLFKPIEEFVCQMYGIKNCSNVDEARYQKFCSRKKTPEPQQLPPTQDVLLCHLKRVCYATKIAKSSLVRCPAIPSPDGYGWKLEDGELKVEWMIRQPIPDDLVEFMACRCQKSKCTQNQCICVAHNLKCTGLCTCKDCENQDTRDSDQLSDYDSSDEEFEGETDCSDEEF